MSRPVLITPRLRLDPLTEAHIEQLVDLDADPEVLRFIFGRGLTRDEVEQEWLAKRLRPDADARGIGYWAGFTEAEFVGWWCLGVDDEDPEAAELGYRLRRSAWGSGFATEGSRAMLDHAFGTVGLSRVWGETMAVNTGSRHVMEKLGMRLARSYVGEWEYPLPGADLGEVVYEMTSSAWAGGG